jgi:transcriptional regulator with XRE-family HTH domain
MKEHTETYERLRLLAKENGVNLTKACRVANVERSTVERWKKSEPQTILMIRRLEEAIIKLGKECKE